MLQRRAWIAKAGQHEVLHRIQAGPASPAKRFFWHSIVLPNLADVVSNGATLLKAMEDIVVMAGWPGPAGKMHLPVPNVGFAYCVPQAWDESLRSGTITSLSIWHQRRWSWRARSRKDLLDTEWEKHVSPF